MGLSNLSFSATNINAGNDADKPANCKPGDIYIATDTNIMYKCNESDVWVNASPYPIYQGVYAGDATTNRAIAHNLNSIPKLVILHIIGATRLLHILPGGKIQYMSDTGNATYSVTAMDEEYFYVGNASNYDYSGNGSAQELLFTAFR
jgi:hypothetical protein